MDSGNSAAATKIKSCFLFISGAKSIRVVVKLVYVFYLPGIPYLT
jgi:hypothetical protein